MELNLVSASFERDPEDQKFERMVDKEGNEVFNGQKGFPQPTRYKDWTFGVLFLFHLALVIYPFIEALNPDDIVISSVSTHYHITQYSFYPILVASHLPYICHL